MPQMPQWPSMLTSQSTYQVPLFPSAPPPITPASPTPVSATLTQFCTSSTPRKTLTDADRRNICQYHEDNPAAKQTEIGAMFGVERSTVSKVLRQKEKYLYQHDGSSSTMEGFKGKPPERENSDTYKSSNQLPPSGSQISTSSMLAGVEQYILPPVSSASHITPSQEEAACAIETVVAFFQSRKADFPVKPQDLVILGKLCEKLRIERSSV